MSDLGGRVTLSPGNHELAAEPARPKAVGDFVDLLRAVVPLLESVHLTIEESSLRIPRASKQLSNVTEATESATVEILNLLESMTGKVDRMSERLGELKSAVTRTKNFARRFVDLVAAGNGSMEPRVHEIATTTRHFIDSTRNEENIASIEKLFGEIRDDATNIAVALQVQDITSQQIAGVNNTIETVREQLEDALTRFEQGDTRGPAAEKAHDGSFDTEACYTRSPERQHAADEIVNQWKSNGKT